MKANTRYILLFFVSGFSHLNILAQEPDTGFANAFEFEASYIGENVNNVYGGIKTGSCYLGMANFNLGFDFKKIGWKNGGRFFINAANTHGACPSEEFTGDFQVASNIEAGNHTYIQELWYQQVLGKAEITVGLQDLNVEFANTENGAFYLNSSFGILPTISGNLPAPIFPLTSLGLSVKWNVSEKISWLGAIYDGCPTDFDDNPYNLKWQFLSGDGMLAISELQYATSIKGLSGSYKFGIYSHNHLFDGKPNGNMPDDDDSIFVNKFGLYFIGDQVLWQKDSRLVAAFLQIGYGPKRHNYNYFYLGSGINFTGLLSRRNNDVLGLALATTALKGISRNETTLELTYQVEVTGNIFIQPDIQYIIYPAGTGAPIKNCLEPSLRFGVSF